MIRMPGLFATKTMVGVEIDDGEIRGVELEKHQGRLSLGSWGSYPLPDNAVKEGVILQPEKVGGALEELWRQEGFRQREIITGVSNQGVLVRFASFPQVPPEKLDGMIRFQAQDHLPVPLPSVILDYSILGKENRQEESLLEVLLVAGRRDMLDGFVQSLRLARLEPREIEVLPLALLRFLQKEDREKVVAIVDIANGVSNVVIAEAGNPRLARIIPTGLQEAEELVAAGWELENLPKHLPSDSPEANSDGILINNLRTTIGFYQSQGDSPSPEKILLSGKGALIPGLPEHLHSQLGIPVSIINPLERLGIDNHRMNSFSVKYALSMSLACRGWED